MLSFRTFYEAKTGEEPEVLGSSLEKVSKIFKEIRAHYSNMRQSGGGGLLDLGKGMGKRPRSLPKVPTFMKAQTDRFVRTGIENLTNSGVPYAQALRQTMEQALQQIGWTHGFDAAKKTLESAHKGESGLPQGLARFDLWMFDDTKTAMEHVSEALTLQPKDFLSEKEEEVKGLVQNVARSLTKMRSEDLEGFFKTMVKANRKIPGDLANALQKLGGGGPGREVGVMNAGMKRNVEESLKILSVLTRDINNGGLGVTVHFNKNGREYNLELKDDSDIIRVRANEIATAGNRIVSIKDKNGKELVSDIDLASPESVEELVRSSMSAGIEPHKRLRSKKKEREEIERREKEIKDPIPATPAPPPSKSSGAAAGTDIYGIRDQ